MKTLNIVKIAAITILASSSFAYAERFACDCVVTDWYEDGSEATLEFDGNTKAEAIAQCKAHNGKIVPGSCQSLGRGDR